MADITFNLIAAVASPCNNCDGSITIEYAGPYTPDAGHPVHIIVYRESDLLFVVDADFITAGPYTFADLCPGAYVVTAAQDTPSGQIQTSTDIDDLIRIIVGPGVIISPSALVTNVSVIGGSNGSVTISATGTFSSLEYKLGAGAYQNSPIFTGLSAGTYSVTLRDKTSGCTEVIEFTVTEPAPALTATGTHTDVLCTPDTGTATAHPFGGSGDYTYNWDDDDSQTTQTATGLAPGIYDCLITDNVTLLFVVITVTIIQLPVISVAFNSHNPSSPTALDGWIQAVVSGGSGAHTFLWNTGATGSVISGLGVGTYSVVVDDVVGCTKTTALTSTAILKAAPTDCEVGIHNAMCCAVVKGAKAVSFKRIGDRKAECMMDETIALLAMIWVLRGECFGGNCLTNEHVYAVWGFMSHYCKGCGCAEAFFYDPAILGLGMGEDDDTTGIGGGGGSTEDDDDDMFPHPMRFEAGDFVGDDLTPDTSSPLTTLVGGIPEVTFDVWSAEALGGLLNYGDGYTFNPSTGVLTMPAGKYMVLKYSQP